MPDTTLTKNEYIPIGVITEVHGPVVVITCSHLPALRRALYTRMDHETYLFEVHQHLDEQHIRAITLHRSAGLRRGMPVYDTGALLHVPVSPACLGRLLNFFGEPLDAGDPLPKNEFRNIHARPVPLKVASESDNLIEALERLGHADTAITQRVYRRKPIRIQPLRKSRGS